MYRLSWGAGHRVRLYLCLTTTAQLQGHQPHKLPDLNLQAFALKRGASCPQTDRAHALCTLGRQRKGPLGALRGSTAGLHLGCGSASGSGRGQRCGRGGHGDGGEGRSRDVGRGGPCRCGCGRRGGGRGGGEGRVRNKRRVLEAQGDLCHAFAVWGQQQLGRDLIGGVAEAQLSLRIGPKDVTPAGQKEGAGQWGGGCRA